MRLLIALSTIAWRRASIFDFLGRRKNVRLWSVRRPINSTLLLKTTLCHLPCLVRRLTPLFDGCKMMIVCGLVSSVVLVCLWLGWSVVKCIQRPMILAINLGPLHFTLHWTPLPSLDVARGLKHDTKYISLI